MARFPFYTWLILIFLQPFHVQACGYGFVGNCSTSIGLRINGTADSFAVAPCPSITDFQGLQLGIIQSLALSRVKSINWESCQNNVTAVQLYFRVYQVGMPGGSWQMVTLEDDHTTVVGAYTTRYRSVTTNINLTSGLIIGKDYTVEAYFRADVDTIGDDSIPETFIVQNNDGFNYRLTFQYGGASAPPFTVVNTKKAEPACHGDSTGNVSVGVYGNLTGLFYHWGYTANNNFNALYNLPAGTYTLTVTGINGFTRADTIQLGQPAAITNQFVNLVSINCNNAIGQVTAQASGGVGPYNYAWSNTDTGPTLTVTTPGNYQLTVTDANNCSRIFTQLISGNGAPITRNLQAEICSGAIYHVGSQSFGQTGTYNFSLPGNGGCDTLVHLELTVLDVAALLNGLPATGAVTCAQSELNLCATAQANAAFSWKKDGIPAVNTPCILATAGGVYTVAAILAGSSQACAAEKSILIEEHLLPPAASITGMFTINCVMPATTTIALHAQTNALNPTYLWTYNGQTLSTTDSCQFTFIGANLVLPTLVVTDAYGCSTVATNGIVIHADFSPPALALEQRNLCNGLTELTYQTNAMPPYEVSWENPNITTNPSNVPPGLYSITITAANGCTSSASVQILPFSLATAVEPATGPNTADGTATAALFGGSFSYTYFWSTGSTGQQIIHQLPGVYCVTATDSDGCSLDTCVTISYPNAIQEIQLKKISLSPNPVTAGDQLTMTLPATFVDEAVETLLFDATGRIILRQNSRIEDHHIQVQIPADLSPGILLIRIYSAGGQAWGRCMAR